MKRVELVRAIIWQIDPYGLRDERNRDPSEYDHWVAEVDRTMRSNPDKESIVATLERASEADLGLVLTEIRTVVCDRWNELLSTYRSHSGSSDRDSD